MRNFYITQILTGHGNINSYLYRFKLTNTWIFPCDLQSEQAYEHIIYNCRLLTVQWKESLGPNILKNKGDWPMRKKYYFISLILSIQNLQKSFRNGKMEYLLLLILNQKYFIFTKKSFLNHIVIFYHCE